MQKPSTHLELVITTSLLKKEDGKLSQENIDPCAKRRS